MKERPISFDEIKTPFIVDYLNGQTEENYYWRDIRLIDIHEGKYPSNSFLKRISEFKNEIAIYKTSYREWRLLTGEVSNHIFSRNIPDDVAVFIHSHPENSYDKYIELPSQGDLANYFKMAKNFIISPKGVTLYTLPKYLLEMDKRQRYDILQNIINESIDKMGEMKINRSNPFLIKITDYKRMLIEEARIKIKLFGWKTKSQILKDFDKSS